MILCCNKIRNEFNEEFKSPASLLLPEILLWLFLELFGCRVPDREHPHSGPGIKIS